MSNLLAQCDCREYQEIERTCFRCKTVWTSEMYQFEKIAKCPQHCAMIAVCGGSPPLCKKCEDEGYYIEPSLGFCNPPEVKKK